MAGYRSLADLSQGALNQQNTLTSTGGITDLALGGAVNLKDKLFFGGTVTIPLLNYNRNSTYQESDANGTIKNFNNFSVNETLSTKVADEQYAKRCI